MKNFKIFSLEVQGEDYGLDRWPCLDEGWPPRKQGWRLPTLDEAMYLVGLHRMGIGGFKNNEIYWTGEYEHLENNGSRICSGSPIRVKFISFSQRNIMDPADDSPFWGWSGPENIFNIRLVRDLGRDASGHMDMDGGDAGVRQIGVPSFAQGPAVDLDLVDALKGMIDPGILRAWMGSPGFGGLYARPIGGDAGPDGPEGEIFYVWDGAVHRLPDLVFRDGAILPRDHYIRSSRGIKILSDGILALKNKILNMIKDLEKEPDFNPFDAGIMDAPIVGILRSIGMEIVSNPSERGRGALALRFPGVDDDFVVEPSGEIYRKGVPWPIGRCGGSLGGIHGLADSIRCIMHVYYMCLRDFAKRDGIPEASLRRIVSILSGGDGIGGRAYREEYEGIVGRYPRMALCLPEPAGGGDRGLIRGARMLGRIGIF